MDEQWEELMSLTETQRGILELFLARRLYVKLEDGFVPLTPEWIRHALQTEINPPEQEAKEGSCG